MSNTSIVGEWVHAHERDQGDSRVFVDGAEKLPPSRGRRRLSFKADGTFIDKQPGADDRVGEANGTYEFDGKKLTLRGAGNAPPVVYEAVAGKGKKRLELKKL